MLIGAHVSIRGGYAEALNRAKDMGCQCVQIFAHNPYSRTIKPADKRDVEKFKKESKLLGIGPNVSHMPYAANLASENSYAVGSLVSELKRAKELGLYGLVIHPGSSPSKDAYLRLARNINKAFEKVGDVSIFIETMAGQGNALGSRFEEIRKIMDSIHEQERTGVCFDTCHVFAAGYDLASCQEEVLSEFDDKVGLRHIKCFHLNDSKMPLGSRKDRHETIGMGKIGLEAFRKLVNNPLFRNVPAFLETPAPHQNEIELLKSLIKQ